MPTPSPQASIIEARSRVPPAAARRADIQGLRALAVVMVVTFHAGLPLPGGFVGVDVFFVISGFVITGMLHREWLSTGDIRFSRFYARRFKRLTPALALTVSVTVVISAIALPAFDSQQNAAMTGLGAMALAANFVIALATGGYFDPAAETNPLLNTWSLSVEEQFYLAFPLLLLIGWRLARRDGVRRYAPLLLVTAIAVGSFSLAVRGSSGFQSHNSTLLAGFYSPLTRAWEFAAGALVALTIHRVRPRAGSILGLAIGIAGACLLAMSAGVITEATPFPGYWTLLPVVGTVLVVLAGADATNPVTRALSWRPMTKIGDWSYSIYLWHWPLIVFAMYLWPLVPYAPVLAAAISVVPALVSYRWVEQPLRRLRPANRRQWDALLAAVMLPPIILSGTLLWIQPNVWATRYASDAWTTHGGDTGQHDFHSYVRDHNYPCTPEEIRDHALNWDGILRCQQSKPSADVSVALVGDSHAESLFLGLSDALPEQNLAYYIIDGAPSRTQPDMARIVDEVAANPTIQTVIVDAYWASRGVATAELGEILRAFRARDKAVFVSDDVPAFPFNADNCKYRKAPLLPWAECAQTKAAFLRTYDGYLPKLKAAIQQAPGTVLLPTAKYFCAGETCDMSAGKDLLYRDRHHLNINGSRLVAQRLLADNGALQSAVNRQPRG